MSSHASTTSTNKDESADDGHKDASANGSPPVEDDDDDSILKKILSFASNAEDALTDDALDQKLSPVTSDEERAETKELAQPNLPDASARRPRNQSELSVLSTCSSEDQAVIIAILQKRNSQDDPNTTTSTNRPSPADEEEEILPGAFRLAPGSLPDGPNDLPPCLAARNNRKFRGRRTTAADDLNNSNQQDSDNSSQCSPSSSSLGAASAVSEEEEGDDATRDDHLDRAEAGRRQRKPNEDKQQVVYISHRMALCLALGFGIIALLAIATILTKPSFLYDLNDDATTVIMDAPHSNYFGSNKEALDSFQDSLPVATSQRLVVEDSPQGAAFQWLEQDPYLAQRPLWRIQQRFAIATIILRSSSKSSLELSYMESECDWTWISLGRSSCNPFTVELIQLQLQGIHASEPLPPEIALLSSLESLDLIVVAHSDNATSLATFLPESLAALSHSLQHLVVTGNHNNAPSPEDPDRLQPGPIPSWIGSLTRLQELELRGVQLTGSLPSELVRLSDLESLVLETNALTGRLDSSMIQSWPNLQTLWLHENQLKGALPAMSKATQLHSLNLRYNQFSGTLPFSWGQVLPHVMELRLSYNAELMGTIPEEWGTAMTSLQTLDVDGLPNVTGSIPQAFCGRPARQRMVFYVDCNHIACCSRMQEEEDADNQDHEGGS